jgi:hypothetical protein
MATQTLTATQLATDGTGTNLTALLTQPTTGTTVLQFQNTLNTILLVQPSATAQTITVEVSCLVDGETVTAFPAVSLTSTDMYTFGPYHSVIDVNGTNLVNVYLGSLPSTPDTLADLLVGVITIPGVF